MIPAIKTITPINRGQVISKSNTDVGEVDLSSLRGTCFYKEKPSLPARSHHGNLRINTFITVNLTTPTQCL